MTEGLRMLDTLAEWSALNTIGNMKNVVVLALEYRGYIDDRTRRIAVKSAVSEHYQLGCCIKEIAKGFKRYLVWEPRPDLEFPVVVSDLRSAPQESTVFETLMRELKPRMDRGWDLFNELPGEYRVIKLADDHQLSVLLLHHVAAAAIGAAEIMADVVAQYRSAVTGSPEQKLKTTPVTSSVRRKQVPGEKSMRRKVAQTLRLLRPGRRVPPAIPVGTGRAQDTDQHCVRRMLTREDTERLALRSGDDLRLIDRLVATSNLAIDRWNQRHGALSGQIVTYVTVNLKDKYEGVQGENSFGFLLFKSRPEDRNDREALTVAVSQARSRQFDSQNDLRTFRAIKSTLGLLRPLPLGIRRRMADRLQRLYRFSIGITFLGAALPELHQSSEADNDSMLASDGIELIGIHGLGYKLTTTAPVVFYVFQFRSRLNIVMTALSSLFTRREAEDFMDLFVEIARGVHN